MNINSADSIICALANNTDISIAKATFRKIIIGRSVYGDSLYVHYKRGKVIEITPNVADLLNIRFMTSKGDCLWGDKSKSNMKDVNISDLGRIL